MVLARERLVWRGREATAVSESPDSEEVHDFGGEGSCAFVTRSYGFRVRRIGPLLSTFPLPPGLSSFVFFGSVRAQFSHGMARFLSFSSYVLRKLESRRWPLAFCALCSAFTLGLPGGVGVSMDRGRGDRKLWLRCSSPFSLSEDDEFARPAFRLPPIIPSESLRYCELVLGRLMFMSSSEQDSHSTSRPSETMSGVGP